MKSGRLLLVALLIFPFCGFAQSLTGLWVGSLSNDSNTVRRDQSFEMALTEYKGKIYGYSHSTFMVNDTLFYVVKRVKGTINGNVAEVKDDELISCNFMTKLDKGVKQVYTFRLSTEDSIWHLDGNWKTTKTKNFYSISGSVKTATEKDLTKSKLFPHLQELNLTDAVASLNPPKNDPPPAQKEEAKPIKKDEPVAKKETKSKQNDVAKSEKKNKKDQEIKPADNQPVTAPQNDVAKTTADSVKTNESRKSETGITSPQKEIAKKADGEKATKETKPVVNENAKQQEVAANKPKETTPVASKPTAAANVEKRRSETIQAIEFKSDSITLALYDNGEIDGDTVSVLVNGELILAQQGLKATAIRKTIYITPAMQDSFVLTLYAENLGKYAPNTGLIIVRDGEETYQVRFSADLQKNVAVVFRRKKK